MIAFMAVEPKSPPPIFVINLLTIKYYSRPSVSANQAHI